MSAKCKAYSKSKLGLEITSSRKAFYAGWDAAMQHNGQETQEKLWNEQTENVAAGELGETLSKLIREKLFG